MLSNSRIYIFGVTYKEKAWLDILETNELSGLLANHLKYAIPELEYQNMQFINCSINGNYSTEIHFNKIRYKEKRTIEKSDMKKLYRAMTLQFGKILQFKYNVMNIVNDEYSKKPSEGFMREDLYYA